MEKQIINNEEEYEKVLKKKIRWRKAFSFLQPWFVSIIFTGGVMASFLMAIYKNPYALYALVGDFALLFGLSLATAPIAVKAENSLKVYEEELQRLEARKFYLGKERTKDDELSKENVTEDTKSEVKTQEVEETLNHSYVYDEMEDIPVLKLPQVKTRIRKR